MTDGYVEKGYKPTPSDYQKIRAFTRKDFNEDELYVFSLILCSNDIDRDFEKFSVKALNELALLFVGKTGIQNHSMKSEDQTARIFETWVEKVAGRKTADGEDYYALKAKAYTVRTDSNKSFITELEAGIKKEVSVSCSVKKSTCSICAKDKRTVQCRHINGREYNGKLCYSILDGAYDAYEWSFVAVPAQRDAGVIKSYVCKKEDKDMNEITKCLKSSSGDVVLSQADAHALAEYIEKTEEQAQLGEQYKKSLTKELISLCAKSMPQMDLKVFEGVAAVMTAKELLSFKNAFEKQLAAENMPSPQLGRNNTKNKSDNHEFKI